jgi:aminopeptidase-like protein
VLENDPVSRLISALFPFQYSITGVDNDSACEILKDILPFKVHEYPSGSQINGWVIPHGWRLDLLQVYKNDEILFEFRDHPFCVPRNTPSVDAKGMSYDELLGRVNRSVSGNSDDFVYDWRNLYRNQPLDWSLCLTEKMIKELDHLSTYRVVIKSTFYPSSMKVLEFDTHPNVGKSILINAHNCHPFQANDDISGVVAGIILAKQWSKEISPNINLKLLIAPELYGPIFYLDAEHDTSSLLGALLLKAVGNDGELKLQESIQIDSSISTISRRIFHEKGASERIYPFRALYGNDEIVFENPPFCIPSITLTRIPFAQYHNSSDTPENISVVSMNQTVSTALDIINSLNGNYRYYWLIKGLPKLSDLPQDLYKPTRAHGIHNEGGGELERNWHLLMNSVPALVEMGKTPLDMSNQFDLPILEVIQYLAKWEEAGFISRKKKLKNL